MSWTLTRFELRKLVEQPMVIIFFFACLLLNSLYVVTPHLKVAYLQYIQETEKVAGNQVTTDFKATVAQLPAHASQRQLLAETAEASNIFREYATADLAATMISVFQIQEPIAEKVRLKYRQLTPIVESLAQSEAALEVGAAGETMPFFTFIHHRLFKAILAESLIFALLLGLYGSTAERLTKTDLLVFTSKTGRQLQVTKYVTSLLVTIAFYVSVSAFCFGLFTVLTPLGSLWQTSISTQFHLNIYVPLAVEIPFITWHPLTLATYTWLSVGLGSLLVFLCHGVNFFVGLWLDDLFHGFIFFVALATAILGLTQLSMSFGWWQLASALMWHPLNIWQNQGHWFTEMGPYSTMPWQETVASGLNLVLFCLLGCYMRYYYAKKEVK